MDSRTDLDVLRREKSLASTGIRTPDRSTHSLVAIPVTPLRLQISVWDDMKIIWYTSLVSNNAFTVPVTVSLSLERHIHGLIFKRYCPKSMFRVLLLLMEP